MKSRILTVLSLAALLAIPAAANSFFFTTGTPDGQMATLSRVGSAGKVQTETADDFILGKETLLRQATFIGLIPTSASLNSVSQVEIEFYHVFPLDSSPFDGLVNTRTNSPADVEIGSATRDSSAGGVTYNVTLLNSHFTAANSVLNGVNAKPGQFTGGEGQVNWPRGHDQREFHHADLARCRSLLLPPRGTGEFRRLPLAVRGPAPIHR